MPLTYYVVQTNFVVDTGVNDSISIGMCEGHDIFRLSSIFRKKDLSVAIYHFFWNFFVLNGLCDAAFSFIAKI